MQVQTHFGVFGYFQTCIRIDPQAAVVGVDIADSNKSGNGWHVINGFVLYSQMYIMKVVPYTMLMDNNWGALPQFPEIVAMRGVSS